MKTLLLCGAAALSLAAGSANAAFLVSGSGENSTYKNGYAGPIVDAVSPITERALFGLTEDRDGNGTLGNLATCAGTTGDICLGIGQGNIVAASPEVQNGQVCVIRADLEGEGTFLFSNNAQLNDWGAIRQNWGAGRITIYTSESSSGSLATLREVAAAAGFDNARIETLPSWSAVQREVERNPRAVGFTHSYPNPSGFLNDLADAGFTVTGLAERALARQTHANGDPIYSVNMTAPYNVKGILGSGGVDTTPVMVTPVVLFGNCPTAENFGADAEYVADVYEEIAALPASEFAVDLGWMADVVNAVAGKANELGAQQGWDFFDDLIERGGALID